MAEHEIIINNGCCSHSCTHCVGVEKYCDIWGHKLKQHTDGDYARCIECMRSTVMYDGPRLKHGKWDESHYEQNYWVHMDGDIVTAMRRGDYPIGDPAQTVDSSDLCWEGKALENDGFLKEPVRNPTDKGKPLYGPPNKRVYNDTEGWEKSTEDMCELECDSVNINLRWICGLLAPLLLFYSFFTACGDNTWLFAGNILLFFIALFVATTALHVPTITIRKQKIRHRILDYTNDLIFDNLTQQEAALCAKISKLPNKNKLIKQCKEYAQTLMDSKTDQSIEPLLTKLYNICEAQLNVGLKENVREVECFISAIEEVEERSEVLNNNE